MGEAPKTFVPVGVLLGYMNVRLHVAKKLLVSLKDIRYESRPVPVVLLQKNESLRSRVRSEDAVKT